MPFTASHPGAVLALARWGLPGSALVMGSIAPDMPMFLPIPVVTHVAHTPPGSSPSTWPSGSSVLLYGRRCSAPL